MKKLINDVYINLKKILACVGSMVCGGWLKVNAPRIEAYKNVENYSRTNKVAKHTERAYNDSLLLKKQVIKYGKMTKDLQTTSGYVFKAIGNFNDSNKFWRLVLSNSNKIILHFGFGF